jgi:hypothetical protein
MLTHCAFYLPLFRNGGAKFSKENWVPQKFKGVAWGVGTAASLINAPSLIMLNPHVKENRVFFGREESLIFSSQIP